MLGARNRHLRYLATSRYYQTNPPSFSVPSFPKYQTDSIPEWMHCAVHDLFREEGDKVFENDRKSGWRGTPKRTSQVREGNKQRESFKHITKYIQ